MFFLQAFRLLLGFITFGHQPVVLHQKPPGDYFEQNPPCHQNQPEIYHVTILVKNHQVTIL